MAADIDDLVEQIGRLADAIDELVGSNTQLMDLMVKSLESDQQDSSGDDLGMPVYLDDPAPSQLDEDQ